MDADEKINKNEEKNMDMRGKDPTMPQQRRKRNPQGN